VKRMWVNCRFRFEGLHCWPLAPEEVSHLRSSHRHEFHIEVQVEVFHGDREVEFQLLKRDLMNVVSKWDHNLGTQSCEHLADQLIEYIRHQYCKTNERHIMIEVSEDGENGAVLSYTP
jgi:6-pyruvoyl-tetrahydropterin synthase